MRTGILSFFSLQISVYKKIEQVVIRGLVAGENIINQIHIDHKIFRVFDLAFSLMHNANRRLRSVFKYTSKKYVSKFHCKVGVDKIRIIGFPK